MNTYNQADLFSLKLAEIADLYNYCARVTGNKTVTKFRDKATAVKRTLEIQAIAAPFMDVEPVAAPEPEAAPEAAPEPEAAPKPEVTKPTKAPKKAKAGSSKGNSKTDMTSLLEIAKERNNKEESIAEAVFAAVNHFSNPTVQQVVDQVLATYKKPRSNVTITQGFVVSTIRYFVKEGSLKFS